MTINLSHSDISNASLSKINELEASLGHRHYSDIADGRYGNGRRWRVLHN